MKRIVSMHRKAFRFVTGIFLLVLLISAIPQSLLYGQENFSDQTIDIGVIVSDLEESMDFYQNVIGMEKVRSFDVDKGFAASSGLSNGVPFHVEVLQLGTMGVATEFKLMTFGNRAESVEDNFIYDHTGPRYITINVDNLTPIFSRIKNHGIETLGETPVPLGEENSFILVQDPDGLFIELIGPMK